MRLKAVLILVVIVIPLCAQERPALWGIARMTFLVSNFDTARRYYGEFLGFDEAFTYKSAKGKVLVFKVNDRQFLEFVEALDAGSKSRLVSVSVETDVEEMRSYLSIKGLGVPVHTQDDGAGNQAFAISDPSGNQIEFISFNPGGLHMQTKGRFLSDRRISKRIHHAGLYAEQINPDDPFYLETLGFSVVLRYPEDKSVKPTIVYFGMSDCTESIEQYSPSDIHFSHACFLVQDMQKTIYTLKERRTTQTLGKPMIGKGRRWILNITDPDGTKVEFTEAFTVK